MHHKIRLRCVTWSFSPKILLIISIISMVYVIGLMVLFISKLECRFYISLVRGVYSFRIFMMLLSIFKIRTLVANILVYLAGLTILMHGCPIKSPASYYVQNEMENLCVATDGIGPNIKGRLQETGNLTMKSCQNETDQTWKFTRNGKNISACIFKVSSSKIHKYMLQTEDLQVNLIGDFVEYWPSKLQVLDDMKIRDVSTGKCLQSQGISLSPTLEDCDCGQSHNQCKQTWRFPIVNDPDPVRMKEQI